MKYLILFLFLTISIQATGQKESDGDKTFRVIVNNPKCLQGAVNDCSSFRFDLQVHYVNPSYNKEKIEFVTGISKGDIIDIQIEKLYIFVVTDIIKLDRYSASVICYLQNGSGLNLNRFPKDSMFKGTYYITERL